jgi:cell division protein FtsB
MIKLPTWTLGDIAAAIDPVKVLRERVATIEQNLDELNQERTALLAAIAALEQPPPAAA